MTRGINTGIRNIFNFGTLVNGGPMNIKID